MKKEELCPFNPGDLAACLKCFHIFSCDFLFVKSDRRQHRLDRKNSDEINQTKLYILYIAFIKNKSQLFSFSFSTTGSLVLYKTEVLVTKSSFGFMALNVSVHVRECC